MMKIGDVTSSYINRLIEAGVANGISREQMLTRHNIDPVKLTDPQSRFGLLLLMKLGAGIIEETKDPTLGLKLAKSGKISRLGFPGLAAMCSKDLLQALNTLTRYEAITSRCYRGQSSVVVSEDDSDQLRFYSISPYNEYTIFVVDMILTGWYETITWLTGKSDLVEEVHFEFPAPDYADQYQLYLPCQIKFGQPMNKLIMKKDAFLTPVLYHEKHTYDDLIEQCDQLLLKLTKKETFGDKVQQVLGPMLHGRPPSIEETADQLGIPTWTLRRKLKDEGISFQNLLDDMRKELALGYMQDTDLTFGEIAYILGFSTPGAFQRAFKRWTNSTPGAYRKSLSEHS